MTAIEILAILRPYDHDCRALLAQMDALGRVVGEVGGSLDRSVTAVISGYSATIAKQLEVSPDLLEEWLYSALDSGAVMKFTSKRPDGSVTRHAIDSIEALAKFIELDRAAYADSLH